MDLLTHGILGATFASSLAPSHQRRLSAALGFAGGLLADADALIQSSDDVLLVLDYHRHFTHALAFAPVGTFLAALLLWHFVKPRLSFRALYGYLLAGYALAGPLDACTSYGTHLWLPFSDRKEAWNLIAVFDPSFTLLLAVPLILMLKHPASNASRWGLTLAAAYLTVGAIQHERADREISAIIQARHHTPESIVVKPTMANQVLWRTLYVHEGKLQVDAFHLGWAIRHYPGESAPLLTETSTNDIVADTPGRRHDLERFRRFSDGFLVTSPNEPGFVGDGRYALLPTRIAPIWGLAWTEKAEKPEFVTRRELTPAIRSEFFAMLLGR